MELTFNKVGKQYEAEFELSADANLHIEFKNAAPVKLYQRTAGSGWDLVNDVKNAVGKATDVDLTSLIYPKFVKVVCVQEPTYATVTTDGEITEIKSQSKEIEVTSNGTTEVTPDAGFSYLSAVKVKTNVATSGGGSASEWKYYDFSGTTETPMPMLVLTSQLAKFKDAAAVESIMPTGTIYDMLSLFPANAVAYDMSLKIAGEGGYMTMGEMIKSQGLFDLFPQGTKEITEEEFYNLNA